MKKLTCLLLFVGIALGLLQGCGRDSVQPVSYSNKAFGSSFPIPAGWLLVEETEREDVLTLKLEDKERESSFITVTVFPATLLSPDETVDQAEQLLRKSLYQLQEPVEHGELTLSGGRKLPLLTALAGNLERVDAWSAVFCSDSYHALITLVSRQEHFDIHKTEFQVMLDSFKLE